MEQLDIILAILGLFSAGGTTAAAIFIKKAIFLAKAAKQAVDIFEDFEKANREIYMGVVQDPSKKELAKVLEGGVNKIKGLTGLK